MISRTGIHAIKALAALSEIPEDEYAGASAIAKGIDAPQNYLGKLLRALSREGLVISQKGLGGGFRLARPMEQISLFDILEPIDQVSRWEGCFFGRAECGDKDPCAVHSAWASVREVYLEFLKNTTLADIYKK